MIVNNYAVTATVSLAVNSKATTITATQITTELQDQVNRAIQAWAAGKNSSVMVDTPVVTVVAA